MVVEVKVASNRLYHISVWYQNHSKPRSEREWLWASLFDSVEMNDDDGVYREVIDVAYSTGRLSLLQHFRTGPLCPVSQPRFICMSCY